MLIFNLSSEKAIAIAEEALRSARVMMEHDIVDGAIERTGHCIHLLGLSMKELGHNYEMLDMPDIVRRLDEAVALLRTLVEVRGAST